MEFTDEEGSVKIPFPMTMDESSQLMAVLVMALAKIELLDSTKETIVDLCNRLSEVYGDGDLVVFLKNGQVEMRMQ